MVVTLSRLYRSTPASTQPLLTVTSAGRTWRDNTIRSVTITHGKADPGGGLHPATAEVEVSGAVGILHDRDVTIRLSDAAATTLGGSTSVAPRFTGRVATQRVTTHPRRGRGPSHSSVLRCSSWSALYHAADGRVPGYNGGAINEMITRIFESTRPRVSKTIPLQFSGDFNDVVRVPLGERSFSDAVADFLAETGYLLRQRRDGTVQAMTLQYRGDAGVSAADNWWPITLGHAVSEVEHEQHTDVADIGIRLTWAQYTGETPAPIYTRDWAWQGSRSGVPSSTVLEWKHYDWQHILWTTEQYRHAINALSLQAFRVAFTTPAISVDLLALARRTDTYSRTMLRQLLRLEQGDPVVFGGDWSAQWNGIYYAEQITERITPDSWTIDLQLYPPQEVTGWYGTSPGPQAPARIWAQHTRPWTTGTDPWN